MKFGVVNKLTTENRFFLHTLQRNITHLAVIRRKTNIKLGILKGGNWKRASKCCIMKQNLNWFCLPKVGRTGDHEHFDVNFCRSL